MPLNQVVSNDANIANLLQIGLDNRLFSAATVQIHQRSRPNFRAAIGLLDPEECTLAQLDSLFDLASLTKPFVAALFLTLVNQELVSLDEPVGNIVREYKTGGKNIITFTHLLNHTSGLPPSFDLYSNGDWKRGKSVVLQRLLETDLQYDPGTETVYSCLGYLLLGHAIELITGKPLDVAMRDFLLKPLGWKDVQYVPSLNWSCGIARTAFSRPNRGELPAGVVHDGTSIAFGGVAGNAGLFGSSGSLLNLGKQMLMAWADNKSELLSPNILRNMSTVNPNSPTSKMGLGWMLWVDDPKHVGHPFSDRSFGHTGFTGTSLWVDPEKELVVAICTNRTIFGVSTDQATRFSNWRLQLHQVLASYNNKIVA